MTESLLVLGGWVAASVAVGVALAGWRLRSARMEAVTRACHELRGPLTAARLGLQLGARTGDLSPARLRAIDLELERAALALADLSSAPTVLSPVATREPVDLAELLSDSVEAWMAAATDRDVQLECEWAGPPAAVLGNRVRLAQATGNLIANAIEHGGGMVQVRGESTGAQVRVEVTDHGPGLPAPIRELARRASRGRGSRGRGLAIAAAVAAEHGGRLGAAPSERGARLVLELPRAVGHAVPDQGSPPV